MSFSSRGDWAVWLAENHADAAGVWLRLERKTPGSAALTYPEAVEAAIAHGWIDGTRKRLDERHYLQRFTPRRARSKWSKINRDKAVDLIERGEMTPAGLREVERAMDEELSRLLADEAVGPLGLFFTTRSSGLSHLGIGEDPVLNVNQAPLVFSRHWVDVTLTQEALILEALQLLDIARVALGFLGEELDGALVLLAAIDEELLFGAFRLHGHAG
jgi:hypothetical protein